MSIRYMDHAREQMCERRIREEWVERVVAAPDWVQADHRPTRKRAFGAVPEAGGKILRVVYEMRDGEPLIVTAFFDRDALRKKPV